MGAIGRGGRRAALELRAEPAGFPSSGAERESDLAPMSTADPICFSCGQATSDPPKINRLDDGRPCLACQDRLLNELPPALPGMGFFGEEAEADAFAGIDEYEVDDSDPELDEGA